MEKIEKTAGQTAQQLCQELENYNIYIDKIQGYAMWDSIELLHEDVIKLKDGQMTIYLNVTKPTDEMQIKIAFNHYVTPAELSEYNGLVNWLYEYVERFKENNKICIESDGQRKEIRR